MNKRTLEEIETSEDIELLNNLKKQKKNSFLTTIDSSINLTSVESLKDRYNDNTVTLTSLLSKKRSTNIIQFNFLLDLDWFMSQVPEHSKDTAKILFVHGMRDVLIPDSTQIYPNTRFLKPHIPLPYGSHHTKAMILFYEDDTMQVIIHTANLIPGDWYYKTQAVWTSPFLSKKTEEYIQSGKECEFEKELCKYIKYYNIPVLNRLAERVSLYNFEDCKVCRSNLAILISSVPGIHRGNELNKWGHLQLKDVLSSKFKMKFDETDKTKQSYIISQISSIGALGKDDRWLEKEFGNSLRYTNSGMDLNVNLKLVYPTVDNVRNSIEGWSGGNSLPFSNSNWQKQSNYMGKILHIWKAENSGRTRAMPHIKQHGGTLQKQGKQLMIRNYELGVLLLPELFNEKENDNVKLINYYGKYKDKELDSETKMVNIPIPFDLPLTPYPPKSINTDPNTTSPWTWDIQRNDLDLFGNKYYL
ncbi:tyrosyl-DNA phosphodiesterase [Anaeromyces robustus]|uniref:Tyrosyl-DNA phosphodiesterase n=1 Tax=Anaeromyces robustus TaxID=1754192 RepID=A0A1Y1XCG6_9FUNG|nr:tyrosyl-DNA phosphodiesterase [Anaeromyces robustus]|eukprot:ORX83439.1 tyrosyl-DNA phosphodiesterase [Anaeromyces robustus]